ncbi:MAG TPA: mercury(II) reductase [Candidatus Wujingus californicus]|uniref:mercury(II) reductase n=1 Tax=Candidatus Wujingus californicus TaxID=3367618 RepID=UPI001D866D5F|nr:mercury(II) reductase [Planctomycetota bacterium]MDO8132116.1 mercury(II) reductase [Candidatus Brocadiales bacterium]
MSNKRFELIIIGGGAAGFAAATRADELKIKTAIVNTGLHMGGTCVNVGCVPTKHLLALGKELYSSEHPKFQSISSTQVTFNFKKAINEKNALLNTLRQKNYQDVLNSFRYVTWIEGRGVFESEHTIKVKTRLIEGDKILIATGCSSKIPPIEGLKDTGFITNRELLSLPKQPSSLVIIGGGPLGLEFAQIFSRMGTKVTLLTHGQRILSIQEPEISELLRKYLESEDIKILTNTRVTKVTNMGKQKEVTLEKEGRKETITTEDILVAPGVVGNIKGMSLEKVGIETEKDCHIKVNEFLQSNIPHIYAAGDCVCHMCLETVAAKEGKIAVENAFENARKKIDFSTVPYSVFTDPEVASVGLTEAKYSEKYKTCDCRTISMDKVPKALAVNDTRGLIKMVVHHETKKIMGVHVLSPVASEIIHEAVLATKYGLTVDDIIDTVHVFPTFSEAIKIAAQAYRRDISTMSCCVE